MTDKEIVEAIVEKNNHDAFRELLSRYQRMVITTCVGFTGSYEDAEDIAQDVFIELFESIASFRNESKLSTWIYRIAVNKSLNFIRKRKREALFSSLGLKKSEQGKALVNTLEVELDSNAEDHILSNEKKMLLRKAIYSLPENQKTAMILSKYQELSYKEISEVMGVSVSSVESLLFRARTTLKKVFSEK